jgi:hypothetical protein
MGNPIGCRNKNYRPRVHETINDYMYGIILRDNAASRPTSHEWQKSNGCEHANGIIGPHDLVLLPLFLIDGKPVYVGDEIMDEKGRTVIAAPEHDNILGAWRWPTPKFKTSLSGDFLYKYFVDFNGEIENSFEAVSSLVLNQAVKDGQVIPAETHRAALKEEHEKARRLRGTDHFLDIDDVGAHVGRIYGSREAIEIIRQRFSENGK